MTGESSSKLASRAVLACPASGGIPLPKGSMRLRVEEAGLTPLNGCRRCGEDFTSLRTFDAHQLIEHVDAGPDGTDLVEIHRCLDSDEMTALGWEEKIPGRWVDATRAREAREAFSRVPEHLGASARGLEGSP
jgi:hypothetical protein